MLALVAVLAALPPQTPRPLHVVVDADVAGVRLYQMRQIGFDWLEPREPFCEAPCGIDLPPGERRLFFVEGPATPKSPPFEVDPAADAVRVKVASGDLGLERLGWGLGLCGAAALIVGADGLLLGQHALAPSFAVTTLLGGLLEVAGVLMQYRVRTVVTVLAFLRGVDEKPPHG